MATYQSRDHNPLFDTQTQAVLQKRARELVGVAILGVGVLFTLLLMSYLPEDPSWLSATDAPVQNYLGRFGATLASPLMIIFGVAAWVIPTLCFGWGARFVLHLGGERAPARAIFVPFAIVLVAIYASTHVSPAIQSYGGLFGDTVLAALIQLLPLTAGVSLKLLSFFTFFAAIAVMLGALGVTRAELSSAFRFITLGFVSIYALILHLLNRGAQASVMMGRHMADSTPYARAPRQDDIAEYEETLKAQHVESTTRVIRPQPAQPQSSGMFSLSKLPSALRGSDELPPSELVEPQPDINVPDPDRDRLRSKIAGAILSRKAPQAEPVEDPHLTPTQRAVAKYKKGPDAMILNQSIVPEYAPEPQQTSMDQFADFVPEDHYDDFALVDPMDAPDYAPAPYAPQKAVVKHPTRKPQVQSRQAKAEAQPSLKFDPREAVYETPPLSLLEIAEPIQREALCDEALEENARMLENVLDDYGVKGEIVSVRPGPVVTMYELEPAPGLKASRVIGLADDIARSMSALSARVSTVPGRSVIGIELPNEVRETVGFREILSMRDYGDGKHSLPLALGKDIGGDAVIANLAKMPHLLIAGTTGSGKSVAINTMILSLLYKLTPEECRLIMIDPKMLELSVYDGIPHLLSPVVTDPKKAVVALKWVVSEMEERYRKMSKMGVRNIDGYNSRVKDALSKGELFSRTVQTGFDDETGDPIFETEEFQPETLPYIVVIVDEMADLMMVAGKEIEACIQRLAQMARASGIHLIMATQRPSVDVITGTIKANFPTRISFQVTSKIDSRTILGEQGAEQLLGMGDMLYMAGGGRIQRCHAPFVSDEEVEKVVSYLKAYGPPEYVGGVVEGPESDKQADIDAVLGLGGNTNGEDALYDQAVAIVIKDRKCSTSYIQRKLSIGYNKAARLVEQMEDEGVVTAANHVGKREILVPEQ